MKRSNGPETLMANVKAVAASRISRSVRAEEDKIDDRIRELRCDPQWCELHEGASEKLLRRFIRYDMENPKLYRVRCRFAEEARNSGRTHFPIDLIYERARWYAKFEATSEGLGLNNSYRCFYARKLIYEYPERFGNGFLATRRMSSGAREASRSVKRERRKVATREIPAAYDVAPRLYIKVQGDT
jgi:hypothetical protein